MDNYKPRLEKLYLEKYRSSLKDQFKYKNDLMIPKIDKVVLNMGIGEAVADTKKVKSAHNDLMLIAGQLPVFTFLDLTSLALIFSGQHYDTIAFFYSCSHYSTSGANDTIFINFFNLNSLTTGPKIRVPIGSPELLSKTAAFVSNLIELPSCLWICFAVLTITALLTSPFLTLPLGIASLIVTTITSPTEAYFLLAPPSTFMH